MESKTNPLHWVTQCNKALKPTVTRRLSSSVLLPFATANYKKLFSCTIVKHIIYLYLNWNMKYRTVIFYKDYFEKFFVKQTQKVKNKVIWTLNLIEEIEIALKIKQEYSDEHKKQDDT